MLFDDVFNTAQEVPLSALSAFILQIHKVILISQEKLNQNSSDKGPLIWIPQN